MSETREVEAVLGWADPANAYATNGQQTVYVSVPTGSTPEQVEALIDQAHPYSQVALSYENKLHAWSFTDGEEAGGTVRTHTVTDTFVVSVQTDPGASTDQVEGEADGVVIELAGGWQMSSLRAQVVGVEDDYELWHLTAEFRAEQEDPVSDEADNDVLATWLRTLAGPFVSPTALSRGRAVQTTVAFRAVHV